MKNFALILVFSVLLQLCFACKYKQAGFSSTAVESASNYPASISSDKSKDAVFQLLSTKESGVVFENNLTPSIASNFLNYTNYFNGGGVAIGDLNNDGLSDIVFTSNQNEDELYWNKGDLKFEKADQPFKQQIENKSWSSGVTIVDVNGDGWNDVYICKSGKLSAEYRANELYINNKDGSFTEAAESYGLADKGGSVHAAFFDKDNDGDLDVFVINEKNNSNRINSDMSTNASEGSVNSSKTEEKSIDQNYEPIDYSQRLKYKDNYGNLRFVMPEKMKVDKGTGEVMDKETAQVIGKLIDAKSDEGNKKKEFSSEPVVGKEDAQKNNDKASSDRRELTLYFDTYYEQVSTGKFVDKSGSMGLEEREKPSLGLCVSDMNDDGLSDVYVAVDFYENDALLLNSKKGTFKNNISTSLKHLSLFAMGVDIADCNNDGLMDIAVAEMSPESHFRSKTLMPNMNSVLFDQMVENSGSYQYMNNTLQLNRGDGNYSEVAQQFGVNSTDWSWGPLFADFDNDGWKDLFISNGYVIDLLDNDFVNELKLRGLFDADVLEETIRSGRLTFDNILAEVPSQKLSNYIYKNIKGETYSNSVNEWGLSQKSFSNGAAYGDLDNDGDLDLVVNNINDPAFVYKNLSADKSGNHYLQVKLKGESANPNGLGAKVSILTDNGPQLLEMKASCGFQSSIEPLIHFGLGNAELVKELIITWPNGKQELQTDIKVDQRIVLNLKDAKNFAPVKSHFTNTTPKLFTAVDSKNIPFKHQENDFDDFKREILLPHKLSQNGPGMAVADVNVDGMDDLYIGGAIGQEGVLYLQSSTGDFVAMNGPWGKHAEQEDMAALFFDADGDGDEDLYVVSGGSYYHINDPKYKDRLYLNQGNASFMDASDQLPNSYVSGSTVCAADVDGDGDQDLFVGGRAIPGKYPYPAASQLLINENGRFKDASSSYYNTKTSFSELGMVTSAIWTDFDNDNDPDLMVVGEWMNIHLFQNQEGKSFEEVSGIWGLSATRGWWNSIASGDFNQDGRMDYVLGNLGWNTKYTVSDKKRFQVYADDFDGSGSNDVYLSHMYTEKGENLPVRGRQCSSEQMPFIADKFPTYQSFALAEVDEILGKDKMKKALHYEADILSSVVLIQGEGGDFTIKELPAQAQFSPVNALLVQDFDLDGYTDVLLSGNHYPFEVETVRADAGVGLFLKGNGKGDLEAIAPNSSGFYADQDARSMVSLNHKEKSWILVANNDAELDIHENTKPTLSVPKQAVYAEIDRGDGKKEKVEFYAGGSYLSQSAKQLLTKDAVTFFDAKGQKITP